MRLSHSRLIALLAGGLLSLTLAACDHASNTEQHATNLERKHPIEVTSRWISQPIEVETRTVTLPAHTAEQVRRLGTDFLRNGGDILEISVSDAAGGRATAIHRAEMIKTELLRMGLQQNEIAVRVAPITEAGPVMLSYERFSLVLPECGNFSGQPSFNFENKVYPNFGCSVRRDLAQMVANPAHLKQPKPLAASDAERRGRALRNYRLGAVTDSALSEQQRGGSLSDVGTR
ncbi:MAG: hypothetical protein FJX68_11310 [Alphaproteobacteria bacterium]|nr:hypothetical protein [Alphaproteobacteria bacterium]